jgi:hypothetical protein
LGGVGRRCPSHNTKPQVFVGSRPPTPPTTPHPHTVGVSIPLDSQVLGTYPAGTRTRASAPVEEYRVTSPARPTMLPRRGDDRAVSSVIAQIEGEVNHQNQYIKDL